MRLKAALKIAKRLWLVAFVGLVIIGISRPLLAQEDDEEFFQSVSRAPAERTRQKAYAGSRDEQPLEIMAALPSPARSPDGSAMPTAPDGEELPATAPESD